MRKSKHSRPHASERAAAGADYEHVTTDRQLKQLCHDLAAEPTIAFDTEFVSEHTYRPQLCLIQVCAGERMAVIDPQAVYTVADAQAVLRLTRSTIGREVKEGRLRVSRRAGRYYLLGEWLLQWLREGELPRREPAHANSRNGHAGVGPPATN